MFKFNCPYCKQPIEADEAWVGQVADCPNCGKSVTIQKSRPSMPKPSTIGNQPSPEVAAKWKDYEARMKAEKETDEGGTMDFCLGLFFSFFGLLLAAIVGGRKGLKRALWGWIFPFVIFVAWFILRALSNSRY